MDPIVPIEFDEYDKISDDLVTFTGGRLRFEVSLSKKDKFGRRKFFHSEVRFQSSINGEPVRRINRSFSYAIVAECFENMYDSAIKIREKDMVMLKTKLRYIISNWLTDPNLWQVKDNILKVVGQYQAVILTGLYDKYISFDPITLFDENHNLQKGIRLSLNGDRYVLDMDMDKFMEMFSILDSISMYQCAITMLNYLEPKYGYNTYDQMVQVTSEDLEPDRDLGKKKFESERRTKKELNPNKRGGFFDKL